MFVFQLGMQAREEELVPREVMQAIEILKKAGEYMEKNSPGQAGLEMRGLLSLEIPRENRLLVCLETTRFIDQHIASLKTPFLTAENKKPFSLALEKLYRLEKNFFMETIIDETNPILRNLGVALLKEKNDYAGLARVAQEGTGRMPEFAAREMGGLRISGSEEEGYLNALADVAANAPAKEAAETAAEILEAWGKRNPRAEELLAKARRDSLHESVRRGR